MAKHVGSDYVTMLTQLSALKHTEDYSFHDYDFCYASHYCRLRSEDTEQASNITCSEVEAVYEPYYEGPLCGGGNCLTQSRP